MFSQPLDVSSSAATRAKTTDNRTAVFIYRVSVLKRAIHAFQSTSSETLEFDYNDSDDNI